MLAGELYNSNDSQLLEELVKAKQQCNQYNKIGYGRGKRNKKKVIYITISTGGREDGTYIKITT